MHLHVRQGAFFMIPILSLSVDLSFAMHFHSNPFCLRSHRWIFLEQLDVQFFDGWEIVEDALRYPLADMFQEFGRNLHFVFEDLVDVRIAHRSRQVVGLRGTAEIGFEFQVDEEIGANGRFLRVHSVIGVKSDTFQVDKHVGNFHNRD